MKYLDFCPVLLKLFLDVLNQSHSPHVANGKWVGQRWPRYMKTIQIIHKKSCEYRHWFFYSAEVETETSFLYNVEFVGLT